MSKRVTEALKRAGAVLVRANRHEVYALPNGKKLTVASTPSDRRAEENMLRDLRHATDEVPVHKEGERRPRKHRPGPGAQDPLGTSRTVLGEAFVRSGVIAQMNMRHIDQLHQLLDAREQEIEILAAQLNALPSWARLLLRLQRAIL
jgi:hypothetical protein